MNRHKQKSIPGRNIRLADQIQKDLALIIQREIDMSRAGLITLSSVDLTADYAHAKVYFTVLGAIGLGQHGLGRFFHDPQLKRGIEMSKLIDQANEPGHYVGVADEPEDKP